MLQPKLEWGLYANGVVVLVVVLWCQKKERKKKEMVHERKKEGSRGRKFHFWE